MVVSLPDTTWGNYRIVWGQRTHVMGIINVTPDSFAGDGLVNADLSEEGLVKRSLAQAERFVAEGATFLDVGGESTRPGADPISTALELARVIPVITALRATLSEDVIISIDTYKAEVARQALAAGAAMINDIWGLRYDPAMATLAAEQQVPIVLMANMRGSRRYEIVSDITRFLAASIDRALEAGVAWERIIVDPGLGFGTTPEENLAIQRRLGELRSLGRPVLLGASRKSTIGRVLGGVPASQRLEGSMATVAHAIAQGVDIVRVHDVQASVRVARMSDAIVRAVFELSPLS